MADNGSLHTRAWTKNNLFGFWAIGRNITEISQQMNNFVDHIMLLIGDQILNIVVVVVMKFWVHEDIVLQ